MAFGAEIALLGSGFANGLWLVFIGWFLNSASARSCRKVVVQDILQGVPVKRMMRSDPPTVSPQISVSDLVHDRVMGTDDHAFPVLEQGGVVGIVTLEDVRSVPRDAWETTSVEEIMTPMDQLTAVGVDEDAAQAMNKPPDRDVRLLPVLSDGTLAGVLRRRDMIRWLRLRSEAIYRSPGGVPPSDDSTLTEAPFRETDKMRADHLARRGDPAGARLNHGREEVAMGLELSSTAFAEGELIPSQYTCDGEDVSPPLTWVGVPSGTERLALILEDIDSVKGVWSHWVVYDMPPQADELPGAVSPRFPRPGGGLEGRNDFGDIGYGGPCPSDRRTHRYVARLYALDRRLRLTPGATREEVLESAGGHVIEEAALMGRYKRLADR